MFLTFEIHTNSILFICLLRYNNCFSVFSVARDSVLAGAYSPVPFDVILVDTASGFDAAKSKYTIASSGFYFIHMSVGVPINKYINYALRNVSSEPNIILSHNSFNDELVTSRSDIQYLNEGQVIYMSSDYTLYSDSMLQTSWSGFNLNDVMSTVVFFRAARTSPYSIINNTLPLDSLLINAGQALNACSNYIVIPKSGIYFLSWSSASVPNTVHIVSLHINGIPVARTLIKGGYYNGSDVSSQTVIVRLNASDEVSLRLFNGPVYSDNNYQTSLTGFLYEPKHNQKVAWTLTFPDQTYLYGPTVVNFTIIDLNEGNGWNSSLALLTVPINGLYYLSLSGVSFPVEYPFNMVLSVNKEPLMNVIDKTDDSVKTFNYNLRCRSLIAHLTKFDELVVFIPDGYNGFSYLRYLTFTGFLIQPDNAVLQDIHGMLPDTSLIN